MDNSVTDTTSTGVDTSTSVDTQVQGQDVTTQSTEPKVIDLDENALIRIKGQEKPVKFGEYGRNFQSRWTQEAQKRALLEKQLQERDARLQQIEAAQRQSQQTGGNEDVFAALRALPYLSGEDAVGVVQAIAGQIQQRDQVLVQALNKIKSLESIVKTINQSYQSTGFESKLDGWFKEHGWNPEFRELAKEIYMAWEGDDLDQEFPRIFSSRIEQIERALEAQRQAKLRQSRPQPFVPGQGGKAGPSKPLQFKADASAREIADQMWPLFQDKET